MSILNKEIDMKPKYMQIYDEIKSRIDNGVYLDNNQQLPNELKLCDEFSCSRMTIKKALDMLVMDGIIYRKKGKGSFVLPKGSFSSKVNIQEGRILGLTGNAKGKVTSQIIHFQLKFADQRISEKLDIKLNDPVYDIVRLRLVDGIPYVLEHTYMGTALIPGLNTDILNKSIYDYIENTLNFKIAGSLRITRADCSNEQDQKYLNLTEKEPVLEVEQVAYLDTGVPFEYSFSRHRYDRFEFLSHSVRRS